MYKKSGDFLAISDLAVYLKILKFTFRKLARENSTPCQKGRHHWHFHKWAVDE
jgi:hypothetical protein